MKRKLMSVLLTAAMVGTFPYMQFRQWLKMTRNRTTQ